MAKAKVKFVWAKDFMKNARTSPEALKAIEDIARGIAADAGEGHEVFSEITGGRGRARASVVAVTPKANARNRKRNVMLQALARAKQ